MKPSLIVHGGAWDIPDEAVEACNSGCRSALEAGWSILSRGGSALDAVEAAIVVLEDEPVFDAGFGSHLNLDGRVECDAIVMNGATLRAGAVAALQHIRNPIRLARAVLEHCPHMMLVGEGAERFARDNGIALCNPAELVSDAEREAWRLCSQDKHAAAHHRGHEQGTVGAVAIDSQGKLFAATSTGGTCCKLPGRVGDSPLDRVRLLRRFHGWWRFLHRVRRSDHEDRHGQDGYRSPAERQCISVCPILRATIRARCRTPAPRTRQCIVAREAVHLLGKRTHATGGLILLDSEGNPGFAFNTPRMAYGYVAADGSFFTAV